MNEPFVNARNFYSEPDWNEIAENRVKLEMAEVFRDIGIRMRNTPSLEKMKIIGYSQHFRHLKKLIWYMGRKHENVYGRCRRVYARFFYTFV